MLKPPIIINNIPLINFNGIACKYVFAIVPARTAIAEDRINAPADAQNIINGVVFLSVANNNVAIWVLSPSSARKTDTKTIKKVDNINLTSDSFYRFFIERFW